MAQNASSQSGDPGRTPGSAEGDEETIDQDLADKGLGKQSTKQQNSPINSETQQDKTNKRDKS